MKRFSNAFGFSARIFLFTFTILALSIILILYAPNISFYSYVGYKLINWNTSGEAGGPLAATLHNIASTEDGSATQNITVVSAYITTTDCIIQYRPRREDIYFKWSEMFQKISN